MSDPLLSAAQTLLNDHEVNWEKTVVSWIQSTIGPLVLAADDRALLRLEFADDEGLDDQIAELRKEWGVPLPEEENAIVRQTKRELAEYFDGSRRHFSVPLAPTGTPFQKRVWNSLLRIRYGETWSYEELARQAHQRPSACRAVGQANGRNQIVVIIPCHRVVNKSGKLGGFGGGLWRKEMLLDLERGV
jgi:AraC family transcriptional regulator of adaptative response/methylated-DNA-[protein]-cysteine methyltransferase